MKIAEVILARSIWLFDTYELNPRGVSLRSLYKSMVERYHFLKYPKHSEDLNLDRALQFQDGTFTVEGKGDLWVNLQLFNDGLIADTRSSTSDSEAFLEDLLHNAKEKMGLKYHSQLVRIKDNYSGLTVFPAFDLHTISDKLAAFAKTIAEFEPARTIDPQHLSSIQFKSSDSAALAFTFERRVGTPFSENKYYSYASLTTNRHIQLLDTFEKIMID